MLLELNVNDIALIKKAGVMYGDGLNIMTGETGAGKSVIIGSCLLCLGGKAKGDVIREGAESAYIELLFSVDDEERKRRLSELGVVFDDDGLLSVQRRIMPGRSISRVNGVTVTLSVLKAVAHELIDIYGQNEYHTLLDNESHLKLLDTFMGEEIRPLKEGCRLSHKRYKEAREKLKGFTLSEEEIKSEASFLEYCIGEIEKAHLSKDEEEELQALYKKLNNARNIVSSLSDAYKTVRNAGIEGAVREVQGALRFDESLNDILKELLDAQSILSDIESEISSYVSEMELSDEALNETGARLDLIRNLEAKYGRTIEDVLKEKERKEERLKELTDYGTNKEQAEAELIKAKAELKSAAEKLSEARKKGAVRFCAKIKEELLDLSFTDVVFDLSFKEKEPDENGLDEVCFMAALNPGEPVKPVQDAASGGELSRIMLSIKTVLAGTGGTPTLIFDEIDTGISGRTAQKVAEKLCAISRSHQVICITHLPQIAAMADNHFVIEKNINEGRNVTEIRKLQGKEPLNELARLLGGAEVTEACMSNAREMKESAKRYRESIENG